MINFLLHFFRDISSPIKNYRIQITPADNSARTASASSNLSTSP